MVILQLHFHPSEFIEVFGVIGDDFDDLIFQFPAILGMISLAELSLLRDLLPRRGSGKKHRSLTHKSVEIQIPKKFFFRKTDKDITVLKTGRT
jgi:hypothetical protein